MTVLAPLPQLAGPPVTPLDEDADRHHIVCCDDDIAICGQDVSQHAWSDGKGTAQCQTCRRMERDGEPCPVPGCDPKDRPQ